MNRFLLLSILGVASFAASAESAKLWDWEFRRGNGAWKAVTVPHDWAISGPFDKEIDKQVIRIKENQEKKATEKTGRTGSLPWIGSGEYRRKLKWPAGAKAARLYFHGVMSEPEVFLGGERIGGWKNGYAPFSVELKRFDGERELLVKVYNREESSRWYPGAGICREVELKWDEPVRPEYVQVLTERIEGGKAFMRVISPAGTRRFSIENPRLWTPETPHLYTLQPEGIRYGVRTIEYGPDFFKLNGVKRKFKGVCLHHDLGPFGAAFDEWAFRRQVALLKEMGCDSIRTSHNIPAPRQLDICDEMGMMVMAESFDAWEMAKVKNGYNLFFAEWWKRDLESLVRMARNHPSVVMWSIGNEVTDQTTPRGAELTRAMQDFIHSIDEENTRLVTQGASWMPHAIKSGVIAAMEIPAVTYRLPFYEAIHAVDAKKPMLGAETASTVSSRGTYKFPIDEHAKNRAYEDGQCSGYDTECCIWSNLPDDDWAMQDDHSWTIGEFVWTGFDYLGEPTPYDTYWPSRSSYFGILDLAGIPKDRYYLYRSRWNELEHTVKICPSYWNFPGREGKVTPVYVYTDGVEGELFLNGKSLGRAKKNPASRLDRYRLRWNSVVYEPGELKAVAYDKEGKAIGVDVLRTAGAFDHFKEESRAFGPYSFTTVTAVDRDGNLCPYYDGVYEVKVPQGRRFKCICNGDATSLESFVEPRMKLFRGQLVYVTEEESEVRAAFRNPPRDAWPQIWFHWNDSGIVREALVKDLEAIAAAGFRRAAVIVPSMMNSPIKVEMMSEEWLSVFDFALKEAKRRGITIGIHNCPGWSSSGGPWITPENSMKIVVSSVKDVKPGETAGLLPMPRTNCGFYRDIETVAFPVDPVPAAECSVGLKHWIPLKDDPKDGYSIEWNFKSAFLPSAATLSFLQGNVNVLAVVEGSADGAAWTELGRVEHHFIMNPPSSPKTLALKAKSPVKKIRIRFFSRPVPEWQGGKYVDICLTSVVFDTAPMFAAADIRCSASGRDLRYVAPADGTVKKIAPADILTLTKHLDAGGNLDWRAPARDDGCVWRVLRLGYTSSGKRCAPATLSGLECDKLSKKGIDAHWKAMPQKLLSLPNAKGTLDYMFIDSWEVGGQNWTEGFAEEFRRNRGYSLLPFLPVYAGYIVGSAETTSKVLYDLQRVISDLICENYYGRFAQLCREAGIRSSAQSYGGPFDIMHAGSKVDDPEGEFWYLNDDSNGEYGGTSRLIASVAHLNGRRIASSEAFTSDAMPGRWQMTMSRLRQLGDFRWSQGINRFTVHSYLHQPWNVKPGISLGRHGSQLNRYTTWWPEARAWTDYLKRGEALLQAGDPEMDALVLRGEGCMEATSGSHGGAIAAGYSFDFCSAVDLTRLEVRGHSVAVAGLPNSYPLLFVGCNRYLSIAEVKKIAALAKSGARIAGGRPEGTPTLMDDVNEWQTLVKEIWDGGLVLGEDNLLKVLRTAGIKPCFKAVGPLNVIRRRLADGGKVFFVFNDTPRRFSGEVAFDVEGRGEVFDAVSGEISPYGGSLDIEPRGSAFVVFERGWRAEPRNVRSVASARDVSDGWTIVSFAGNDAPSAPLALSKLMSWSESADEKLRYFSGRALYEKTFDLSDAVGKVVTLDLGEVENVANVLVNGKKVACLWCKPYRTSFKVPSGKVRLGVEVINTWPNRLIGDALIRRNRGVEKKGKCDFPQWVLDGKERGENGATTWSNYHWAFKADEPLRPAGLLGPVRISVPLGGILAESTEACGSSRMPRTVDVAAAKVLSEGFTITLQVDFSNPGQAEEQLCSVGPVRLVLRQAGADKRLADYDLRYGNYLNWPKMDGSCPVIEATIAERAARVGIPFGCLAQPDGVHKVTLHYAPVRWTICVDGHIDEAFPVPACPVAWPSVAEEKVFSPRVKECAFVSPARKDALPPVTAVRPIAESIQYWTPPGHNTWVGDVAPAFLDGKLHVFYLLDRRHHSGGMGTGRHQFAHLSTDDLRRWAEHPLAVPIREDWQTVGTGTPFLKDGKLAIAFGWHTSRYPQREGKPIGGTYAISDDGVNFTNAGVIISNAQNPSIYNLADGRYELVTSYGGSIGIFRSRDLLEWDLYDAKLPFRGDCPSLFDLNGHRYLLQGFTNMAYSADGRPGSFVNWTNESDVLYEGLSVPMVTKWKDGRRLYIGWLNHLYGWGGWLVFREVVAYPDGRLGLKWVPEIVPPTPPREYAVKGGDAFRLKLTPQKGGTALVFSVDPVQKEASFGDDVPNLTWESPRHAGNFKIGGVRGLDRDYSVRLIVHYDAKSDVTIFDAEIAGQRTLICRRGGRWKFSE